MYYLSGNQSVKPFALTAGANIATDASLSNSFTVTLNANSTLDNPTNLVNGMALTWVINNGTSPYTLAYGSKFKWGKGGTGSAPVLSTTASKIHVISGAYDSASDTILVGMLDTASSSGVALSNTSQWTKNQSTAPVALTDATNIATDASLSNSFTVTLGGNRTLDNPSNLVHGMFLTWLVDNGTSPYTLAYGSKFKWGKGGTGSAPVLSTTASKKHVISGFYDSASDTILAAMLDTASGTGSTQGLHSMSLPAGAWYSDTTEPAEWARVTGATGYPCLQGWGFHNVTEAAVYTWVRMPKQWNAGTITYSVDWFDSGAGTGDVKWSLRAVAFGDTDVMTSTGYGTAQTVVDTDSASVASKLWRSPVSSALTIAGTPQKEDIVMFELRRKPADASDTLVDYADMFNVTIHYTTDADTDA